jgi:hypothetical protein
MIRLFNPKDPNDDSFFCKTCGGTGGLQIGNATYLDVTCPTCQGLSRGMSAEEYWQQLKRDEENSR